MAKQTRALDVYRQLYAAFGPQHWWPAQTRWEVIVGAILTQNAAWANVEKAIANLKREGLMPLKVMAAADEAAIAAAVRPSGYYNQKAKKLKATAVHIVANYGGRLDSLLAKPVNELRAELLSMHGFGPETADSVILYAAGKPVFVIDAYTKRIAERVGLDDSKKYEELRAYFESNLPKDAKLFNEYHALLVELAKRHCKIRPVCAGCPINDCAYRKQHATS